jgi:phosphoribosyl 1,2-cyclic phosphodiesterase
MRVTFYGVRGSIATPGLSTVRYGGNTVCVDVRLADGTVLVLDAGTGIRELGRVLLREGHRGAAIHLLITHAHWDHILGIPFFGPIWRKDTHLLLYPLATTAQERIRYNSILFDEIHFPVRSADIPAKIELIDAPDAQWQIGSAHVSRIPLNHPGGAQGFRIDDDDGSSLCYLTDNELSPPGPAATSADALARFAHGAGLVIHDAQYVEADMPAKRGWGHSVVTDVLELARQAEARSVALFHHEPERDDEALDRIGVSASAWLKEKGCAAQGLVAREGLTLTLEAP